MQLLYWVRLHLVTKVNLRFWTQNLIDINNLEFPQGHCNSRVTRVTVARWGLCIFGERERDFIYIWWVSGDRKLEFKCRHKESWSPKTWLMSFVKVKVLLNKHFSLIEKEIEIGLLFTSSELLSCFSFYCVVHKNVQN